MTEWKRVKIGEVCRIEKGATGIASATPGDYPLVVTALERKTCSTYQFDCEAVCIPLVSSSGHGKKSLKYVHYQSGKFALGTILAAVIPNDKNELSARYLHQYLQFYKDTLIVPLMHGAANVSLAIRDIEQIEIPLPPIEKQNEFAKLFVRMQENDVELQTEFETQKDLIKKLRQSILQDAIEGKLTEDWRKENPLKKGDINFDAEALFEKIQEKKNKQEKGNKKKKDNGKVPIVGDDERMIEIPGSWKWVKIESIGYISGGKRLPVGTDFSEEKTSHAYIRIRDMKNGSVETENLKYISNELHEKLKQYCIYKDELYITIAGTIGAVGTIPDCLNGMNLTENSSKMKPFICDKNFLKIFLSANFIQQQFSDATKGMALPKLAIKRINDCTFPLPPLAEQNEIVRRVENRLSKVEQLEQQVQERENLTKSLFRGILKNAFEGRGKWQSQ